MNSVAGEWRTHTVPEDDFNASIMDHMAFFLKDHHIIIAPSFPENTMKVIASKHSDDPPKFFPIKLNGEIQPNAMAGARGILIDNHIYVFGGYLQSNTYSNTLYKIDLRLSNDEPSATWSEITPAGLVPPPRAYHAMCPSPVLPVTSFCIYGGCSIKKYFSDIWIFDLKIFRWTAIAHENTLPCVSHAVMMPSPERATIYIYGGWDNERAHSQVYSWKFYNHSFSAINPTSDESPAVLGGISEKSEVHEDVWLFHPLTRMWVSVEMAEDAHMGRRAGFSLHEYPSLTSDSVNLMLTGGASGSKGDESEGAFACRNINLRKLPNSNSILFSPSKAGIKNLENYNPSQFCESHENNDGANNSPNSPVTRENLEELTVICPNSDDIQEAIVKHARDAVQKCDTTKTSLENHHQETNFLYDINPDDTHKWIPIHDETNKNGYPPRTGHTAVALKDSIYVFAGTSDARLSDVHKLKIITPSANHESWSFNWEKLKVSTKLYDPEPRSGVKSAPFGDSHIVFFGGYQKKNLQHFQDCFALDIHTSKWIPYSTTTENPAPCARCDHAVAVIGDKFYVFGGYDGKNRFKDLWSLQLSSDPEEIFSSWTLEYDPAAVPVGSMHFSSRFGHSMVPFRDTLIAFGGWNGRQTLDELLQYDLAHRKWEPFIARGQSPSPRYRHDATVQNESLMMVFGGVSSEQVRYNDLYVLDLLSRIWTKVDFCDSSSVPPTPRSFHQCVSIGNSFWVTGGFDGKKRGDTVFCLLPSPREDQRAKLFKILPVSNETTETTTADNDEVEEVSVPLRRELDSLLEVSRCKLCRLKGATSALIPCGHRFSCEDCCAVVVSKGTCPICAREVASSLYVIDC